MKIDYIKFRAFLAQIFELYEKNNKTVGVTA